MQTKDTFISQFLLLPKYRVYRYLSLFFAINIMLLTTGFPEDELNNWGVKRWLMHTGYVVFIFMMFYYNIYWAVPRLLLKNRFNYYGIFLLISVVLTMAMVGFLQLVLLKDFEGNLRSLSTIEFWTNVLSSILNVTLVQTGITTILLYRYWIISNQQIGELQEATLSTELEMLKNQINPHFLFNMLNNANVLIRKDGREASRVLFKLEDLLRYQMDDSTKETVSLESDISFLTDYLSLEKIRRDRFEFSITFEGDIRNVFVPPLLFIPFVENAVKYSADSEDQSFVKIRFSMEGNLLKFECINSRPLREIRKGKSGGLGLKNISRRLELLFPGKHILDITDGERLYAVNLQVELTFLNQQNFG